MLFRSAVTEAFHDMSLSNKPVGLQPLIAFTQPEVVIIGGILGNFVPCFVNVLNGILAENLPTAIAIPRIIDAPQVAECGGFIYLHDELEGKDGIVYSGVGIIKGRASAGKRLLRFGYIEVSACKDTLLLRAGEKCKSHEFHYWDSNNTNYSCRAVKANKSKAWDCIYSDKNIFAGFLMLW